MPVMCTKHALSTLRMLCVEIVWSNNLKVENLFNVDRIASFFSYFARDETRHVQREKFS